MKRLVNLLIVAAACVVLAACSGSEIKGNGKVTVQNRNVSEVNKLRVNGDFVITVHANQPTSSVAVKTDSNLQPYLITMVKDKALEVRVKKGYRLIPTTPIQVVVNTKGLSSAMLAGKSTFVANGLSGDLFRLAVTGMSTTILNGEVDTAMIETNGAAHVNAGALQSDDAKVKILGLGKVTVMAKRKLDVYIKGHGQVTYFGQPPIIDREVYDGGKLTPGQ